MYIDDDLTGLLFTPKSIEIRLILLILSFLFQFVHYAAGVYAADEKKKGHSPNLFKLSLHVYQIKFNLECHFNSNDLLLLPFLGLYVKAFLGTFYKQSHHTKIFFFFISAPKWASQFVLRPGIYSSNVFYCQKKIGGSFRFFNRELLKLIEQIISHYI